MKAFDELRDKKRRPKSYKTSKATSYKDNVRQLIETQMELMQNMNEETIEAKKLRRAARSPQHDYNKHKRSHSKELMSSAGHSSSKHSHSHHKHKKHKRSEHKS